MEVLDPGRGAVAADHGRRAAVRRRRRRALPRARPGERRGAVGNEPRLGGDRLSGDFRGGRAPTVAVSTGFWLGDSFTPELVQGGAGHVVRVCAARCRDRPARPAKGADQPGGRRISKSIRHRALLSRRRSTGPSPPRRRPRDGASTPPIAQPATARPSSPAGGVPPVKGDAFLANWRAAASPPTCYAKVKTMPPRRGQFPVRCGIPRGDGLSARSQRLAGRSAAKPELETRRDRVRQVELAATST